MKHPLPPARRRWRLASCTFAVFLCILFAIPIAAQDAAHHRNRHEAQTALRIEVRIVSYAMTPPRHHKDDDGDGAVRFEMPSRDPKMTVIEQTRDLSPAEISVTLGPEGAVLKTLTVVPE